MVMGVMRGRCVCPNNEDARPLAVDSVCGGDSMAATVFVTAFMKTFTNYAEPY
jgi:hypothetical protein